MRAIAALLAFAVAALGWGPSASAAEASAGRGDAVSLEHAERAESRLVLALATVGGVRLADLPPEAREALARIERGGPFPYDKDGTVFGNREGLLPARPRGYYREYTVRTPGARDRGARRIVVGGAGEHAYYTDDHYRTFRRIQR